MTEQEQKRTEFAMAAVDFAGIFKTYFDPVSILGFKVGMTAPEGQSTGGGVQARQHITLTDDSGKTVVVGACNTVEKTAELRTFEHVSKIFSQRYENMPFPVPRGEYDDLRQKFAQFFQNQSFHVSTADFTKSPNEQVQVADSGSSTGIWIAIGLVCVAIVGGLVWYFVLRH